MAEDALFEELTRFLHPIGQIGVLRWWDDLSSGERAGLARQIRGLDRNLVGRLAAGLREGTGKEGSGARIQPPEIQSLAEMDPQRAGDLREAGEEAIRRGDVACYMVAGGQASRLGIDGPKGAVPIGPVSGKSLFQLHSEKILGASRRYGVEIPWLILTSDATDADTKAFFEKHRSFGLADGQVSFLRQDSLPAFDPSGAILMRSRSELFLSPDGHGGAIRALWNSGALDRLMSEGRRVLSYFQVDNPLAPAVDPLFLGLHLVEGADVSSKAAERTDPEEKVGVFALREGRLGVLEYTEVSQRDRAARDETGRLLYRGGSLAIHAWSLTFLDRLRHEGHVLPYHPSGKVIPCLDESGRPVTSTEPNGIKFESFIFDAIPLARKAIVVEIQREEEFQPVKSATGRDTLEQARQALSRLHARWLEGVAPVPREATGEPRHPIEVSPLYALDAEELRRKAPPGLEIEGPLYLGPDGVAS